MVSFHFLGFKVWVHLLWFLHDIGYGPSVFGEQQKPNSRECGCYLGYSCITTSSAEVLGLLTALGNLLDRRLAVLEVWWLRIKRILLTASALLCLKLQDAWLHFEQDANVFYHPIPYKHFWSCGGCAGTALLDLRVCCSLGSLGRLLWCSVPWLLTVKAVADFGLTLNQCLLHPFSPLKFLCSESYNHRMV